MPLLVVVAGPNGSGKTTLVQSGALAPAFALPALSINADDIARSLAGDRQPNPEESLRAAQIADARLDASIASGSDVLIETVLSSDKFKQRVLTAKRAGFEFILVYVTVLLETVNVGRVAERVELGGHPVPVDRILARRQRSHAMFEWFSQAADKVLMFDNSASAAVLSAIKDESGWAEVQLHRLPPDLGAIVQRLAVRDSH